jgi:uncharacterized membrane protein
MIWREWLAISTILCYTNLKNAVFIMKQRLTKQDIQKELLTRLNERKPITVFLTVIILLGIVLYPIHLIHYLNDTPFDYTGGFKSPDITPQTAMFVIPILIICLTVIVLRIYYMDLYNIKKGSFEIIKEKLCQKEISLYFRCGRITVEKEVYAYSNTGDIFYVVMLRGNRNPQMAYHTKYYEIDPEYVGILTSEK